MNTIFQGDCLDILKTLDENSLESVVTDPPYELGFMGKKWDNTGIAYNVEMWKECLRVLKPGGYLLSFGGTRTYHRMTVAIEDAGFEIRDMIEWVYGSGFPKSLNIGKAVDKLQGNEREFVSKNPANRPYNLTKGETSTGWQSPPRPDKDKGTSEWEGWGTALKPAHEPICMARKPLSEKTVAENVLKWGTGGINIDESRVGMSQEDKEMLDAKASINNNGVNFDVGEGKAKGTATPANNLGRFPANLIHDNSEEVRECFPETGVSKGGNVGVLNNKVYGKYGTEKNNDGCGFGDSGNASRFFKSIIYTAKASKSERNKGCEDMEDKDRIDYGGFHSEKGLIENNRNPENRLPNKNNHPTVKPLALMEYLIKMVTPKGGTVLDPFMGSGTTGIACKMNGYNFIGIELDEEYVKIAEARLAQQVLI
ncbi:MAG: site-specific DNA-methyltransferase [Saprospiraceae bacterium]|nr:site-specific DNA-methyltransferase [Saprospiraceae bacterium]